MIDFTRVVGVYTFTQIKKMIDPYYRPTNKKVVEQKLREYLEKTYGEFYVADGMTFGPYCSDWVKDLTKKKGELEKLTDAELVKVDLTDSNLWGKIGGRDGKNKKK